MISMDDVNTLTFSRNIGYNNNKKKKEERPREENDFVCYLASILYDIKTTEDTRAMFPLLCDFFDAVVCAKKKIHTILLSGCCLTDVY